MFQNAKKNLAPNYLCDQFTMMRDIMCVATLYFYLVEVIIMINVVLTVKLAILHTMYISMTSLCMHDKD